MDSGEPEEQYEENVDQIDQVGEAKQASSKKKNRSKRKKKNLAIVQLPLVGSENFDRYIQIQVHEGRGRCASKWVEYLICVFLKLCSKLQKWTCLLGRASSGIVSSLHNADINLIRRSIQRRSNLPHNYEHFPAYLPILRRKHHPRARFQIGRASCRERVL